ncbi:MAG: HAD-IA family hydrolase [Candidatus Margulisiibacteriota bacterium]
MKLPIDLIMFDLDGTLSDSIPPAIVAVQAMLKELGLPAKTAAEIHKHVGFGELPLVGGAIGSRDPVLQQKALEVYYRNYTNVGIKQVPLYPHVKEFLEHFKEKTKYILSNKKDEFIRLILANHGLLGYFNEICGGDTAPCLKPDPCTILKILADHQITPERALLIGDMTVDIETGKNAGIHTCAVTYGFDDKAKLAAAKPDFLVDDLLELKELIV